jgi:anti-anti-sigma factor
LSVDAEGFVAPMKQSDGKFRMQEHFERDGALRLALLGELDVWVVEQLTGRLRELHKAGYAVRLDLARLDFIDSSGIREMINAVADSRREGWQLDVQGPLTEPVARTIELVGAHPLIWPEAPDD